MKQVLDIAADCYTRHGHTRIGILFTVHIYTISDEDIHVPAIVVEDFDLIKSNKHEKNWMQYHPFSISCPSLIF